MNTDAIFDALKASAQRLKVDGKEVLGLLKEAQQDLQEIEEALNLQQPERVRLFLLRELDSVTKDRPKHILAAAEATAGTEARKLFEEGLTIALDIAVKVLLKL